MRHRLWPILCGTLALLPAAAAVARTDEPIQSYDTYRAWLVVCDNTLTCVAKAFDDGEKRAELRLDRAAGPEGAISLSLRSETRFAIGDLSVDGMPVAITPADWRVTSDDDGTEMTSTRPAAVRALLDRLRPGTRLKLGHEDAVVPLAGMTAALLRIDERQGRIGGTTALVRRGAAPADHVPIAPAVPRIPRRPITARLTPAEATRLIAGIRTTQRALFVAEDCSTRDSSARAEAHALDERRALVLIPCLMGAYQGSSLAFIAPRGGGKPQRVVAPTPYRGASGEAASADLFTEPGFEPETGTLFMAAKGRGLADCGMSAAWIWDGDAFRLSQMSLQDRCGGTQPGDWPTLFRSRQ